MNTILLSLPLLFLAIVPNLGFFTFESFFLIAFILLINVLNIVRVVKKNTTRNYISQILPYLFYPLLIYSALYYGGLYQKPESVFWMRPLILIFIFVFYFTSKWRAQNRIPIFGVILLFYIIVAVVTIVNSPRPACDCFVMLKEAPQKLMMGKNPYATTYTQVYANVRPDYFDYLPFSFIYSLPFVYLFGDPRIGIITAVVLTVIILQKFLSRWPKDMFNLYALTFLFLPRSFYMLEHMYQDTIIFFFFVLFLYALQKKKNGLAMTALSLFFSIKQHLFILLPAFLFQKNIRKLFMTRKIILFFLPFTLILIFFLIDPYHFLKNTLLFFNPTTQPAPINVSLSFPTFVKALILIKNITLIHIASALLFVGFYLIVIGRRIDLTYKIFIIMFLFDFFMYNSFYNHYYFIAQFLMLTIGIMNFKDE